MGTRESTIRLSVADNFSAQLRAFANAIDSAERETNKLASAATQASGASRGLSGAMSALSQIGLGVSLAGITYGLVSAGKASLQLAMDMEQTKIAFTTMTGSATIAQQHLNELRDFAARTPFQFTDLVESSKQMQAFGFSAQEVVPMLTDIGDAVAALGGGSERIQRVTLALGQMQNLGHVSGRDMLQLVEAGIPAWKYLADAIGVTTGEVQKMSEKGLIPADQAIQAILAGMHEDFGGLMAKQAETAAGKISNLVDALESYGTKIGEEMLPVTYKLTDALAGLVAAMDAHYKATKDLVDIGGVTITIIKKTIVSTSIWADTIDRAKDNMNDAGQTSIIMADDAKSAAKTLEDQAKVMEQAWNRLVSGAMSGKITQAFDDYSKATDNAAQSTDEINKQLAILNAQQGTAVNDSQTLAEIHQRLAEAQYKEADAGNTLWQAQQNLADNTDPEKQQELADAVAKAQLAYDGAVISTQGAAKAYSDAAGAVVDNSEKIADLNAKLEDNNKKSEEAKKKMHDLTNEFIFQQASVGLSGEQALELGRALGLVDEQSYSTAKAIFDLRGQFDKNDDGMLDSAQAADEYVAAVDKIAKRVQDFNDSGTEIKQFDFSDIITGAHVAEDAVFNLSDEIRNMPGSQDVYIRTIYSANGEPPRYASGGMYQAGRPMQVERDEIMVPSMNGMVLNKQEAMAAAGGKAGGGGKNINITNHISDRMDTAQFLAQLRNVLQFS